MHERERRRGEGGMEGGGSKTQSDCLAFSNCRYKNQGYRLHTHTHTHTHTHIHTQTHTRLKYTLLCSGSIQFAREVGVISVLAGAKRAMLAMASKFRSICSKIKSVLACSIYFLNGLNPNFYGKNCFWRVFPAVADKR